MTTNALKTVCAIAAATAGAAIADTAPMSAPPVTTAADDLVAISNGVLTAVVSLHGAELKSVRMGDFEYLWQQDPDRPSGLATVLFPICGSLYQGRYTFEGREYTMPGHGFACQSLFRAERSPDGTCAVFTLESNDATKAMYPFDFSLDISFQLAGPVLVIGATVRNTGSSTMPFAYGGHPGFNVPLGGEGRFEDWFLEFAPGTNPDSFEFGEHGLITGHKRALPLAEGSRLPLRHDLFNGPGLFLDRVGGQVSLRSETSTRSVTVRFPDMPNVGFWHAAGEAPFLCIEPWGGLPSYDGVPDDFATRPNMVRLAPGTETTLRFSIEFHE